MRVTTSTTVGGLAGTAATIAAMHALVAEGVRDVRVANLAKSVLADLLRRDYRAEAEALLRWVQSNVRYTRDPSTVEGLERVSHPIAVLQQGGADCDDLAVLYASLAASVGFAYAFRTIGDDETRPDEFRHVYVVVEVPGRGWAAADPSFEEKLGWEPAREGTLLLADGTTVAAARVVRDWSPT